MKKFASIVFSGVSILSMSAFAPTVMASTSSSTTDSSYTTFTPNASAKSNTSRSVTYSGIITSSGMNISVSPNIYPGPGGTDQCTNAGGHWNNKSSSGGQVTFGTCSYDANGVMTTEYQLTSTVGLISELQFEPIYDGYLAEPMVYKYPGGTTFYYNELTMPGLGSGTHTINITGSANLTTGSASFSNSNSAYIS
ncbi:hypothetical protein AAC03nite_39530 [Alicyclobacillus acidoterrestris]|nr:hypothetical protein AAC03nite_39530 [Alicyclobacillus acidoterrestris]